MFLKGAFWGAKINFRPTWDFAQCKALVLEETYAKKYFLEFLIFFLCWRGAGEGNPPFTRELLK